MSQEIISSDPIFNVIFNEKMKRQTITGDKNIFDVELFGITAQNSFFLLLTSQDHWDLLLVKQKIMISCKTIIL
jgi:hypothetical protein